MDVDLCDHYRVCQLVVPLGVKAKNMVLNQRQDILGSGCVHTGGTTVRKQYQSRGRRGTTKWADCCCFQNTTHLEA